ncbi:MAG: aldo/keto reductase [Treponema sp.]|nr:aldo/keto reductase [Treponema sp.]
MEYIGLGKSNLMVSRVGFGAMALPDIANEEDAACLVHKAYDAGVNFYDISHREPDSEKRLGACLSGIRHHVILATKSCADTPKGLALDLEESLLNLQTDYVDLFQYEALNMPVPALDDIVDRLETLKSQGKIRHYGFVCDDAESVKHIVEEGVFETVQLPFNVLTPKDNLDVVELCRKQDVGFVAMQPLYGGLLQNIPLAQGFLYQFENVVPLWGVRSVEELEQILYFCEHPIKVDEQFKAEIQKTRDFFY